MVLGVREDLERCAMLCRQGQRSTPALRKAHGARRQLGVEAGLLPAGWIVVGESDEPGRRGLHVHRDVQWSAPAFERPVEVAVAATVAQGLDDGIQLDLPALDPQDDAGQRRRPQRADLQACGRAFEKCIRVRVEAGHLAPGVAVGVLQAPVVVLAAAPAGDVDGLAIDGDDAGEVSQGDPAQSLGLGEPAVVQGQRQQECGRLGSVIAEVPRQAARLLLHGTLEPAFVEHGVADSNAEPCVGEGTL